MRNIRYSARWSLLLVVALVATACAGGSNRPKSSASTTSGVSLPNCPLDALAGAKKPVQITYWHAMTRANDEELRRLTSAFNASQSEVHVTLSAAPSYPDNLTRFRSGLATGALPDLLQGEETVLQTMIDSNAVLPVAACLRADHADTSDLVPRVVAYYSVKGVLWPMPFNDSNPILYYNKAVFAKAGLDPNRPPTTLDAVQADSRRIVESGAAPYGIAIKTDSWIFEHWLAKAGDTVVNNGNGRNARATAVTFNDATGLELFRWVDDMVKSKLALSTGTGDIDHYLAVGNVRAAMTIDSSAALGTISQLLGSGQFASVKLGVGPMPGPESPQGGVLVGGAANYIMKRSAPEKQAAAYRFAKFLAQPTTQAQWAAATGYVPVSTGATKLSPLVERWKAQPGYKVAYDQLLAGPLNDATAGPVIGAYGARGQGLRGAVIDGIQRMLTEGLSPKDAIAAAARQANAAIVEYNSRVG